VPVIVVVRRSISRELLHPMDTVHVRHQSCLADNGGYATKSSVVES